MRLKREHFANVIIIAVALAVLIVLWITSSPAFWASLSGAIVGPIIAVLATRWIKQFQDERFKQNYNRSSRNAFIFLIFAIPAIPTIHAIAVLPLGLILGLIFLVWAISLLIFYVSAIYYYKKQSW